MHAERPTGTTSIWRYESWFRRHILLRIYACLWNACSALTPHQQMLRSIVMHHIPTGIPFDVLYLNCGTGDMEELIDRERGCARVTSINRFPFCARLVQGRRRVNSPQSATFYQSFRKPLQVPDRSQDCIICMGQPSSFLEEEITRVSKDKTNVVYVAPTRRATMWPMIKAHLKDAWRINNLPHRTLILLRALPAIALLPVQLLLGPTFLFSMMKLCEQEEDSEQYLTCANLVLVRFECLQAKTA